MKAAVTGRNTRVVEQGLAELKSDLPKNCGKLVMTATFLAKLSVTSRH